MNKITNENIRQYVRVMSGELPNTKINNHFGEGFEFQCDNETYHTKPLLNKDGKLIVMATITTWIGCLSYAQHYYASMLVIVKNTNGKQTISGYMGGIEIPEEFETLKLDLCRPLNDEEKAQINNPDSDFYLYEPDGYTLRFNSFQDCEKTIQDVFDFLFDRDSCILEIEH